MPCKTPNTSGAPVCEKALRVEGLSKCYQVFERPFDRLKQVVFPAQRYFKEVRSLRGVSFEVERGEVVGIIGKNGAGKSTLLQVIAGILAPTAGTVTRTGRLFSLLELGCGFNAEFTGRENIYTNAAILGLSPSEIEILSLRAIEFAGIGHFMDMPVKTYSTGMYARLAMAVALHVPADILLIDEILSVGDVFFQMKCFDTLRELVESGRTVLICSHDLGAIRRHCTRVIHLEAGRLLADGEPDDVLAGYLKSGGLEETYQTAPSDGAAATAPVNPTPLREQDFPLVRAPEWQPDDEFLARVRSGRGIVLLDNGRLLVADVFSHGVFEVTREGALAGRWGTMGFGPGELYDPVGLENLCDGSVAAADYSCARIVKLRREGSAENILEGVPIGTQPFLMRIAPDGRTWISCRADGRLRVVKDGTSSELCGESWGERLVTDIAFQNGQAFLVDFRNNEVLVFDSASLELTRTITFAGDERARAPHGIELVNGHMVLTCHDSHTLAVLDRKASGRVKPVCIDLRDHLVECPCYLRFSGERAYVSSSILGGLTAFDVSGWPIVGEAR